MTKNPRIISLAKYIASEYADYLDKHDSRALEAIIAYHDNKMGDEELSILLTASKLSTKHGTVGIFTSYAGFVEYYIKSAIYNLGKYRLYLFFDDIRHLIKYHVLSLRNKDTLSHRVAYVLSSLSGDKLETELEIAKLHDSFIRRFEQLISDYNGQRTDY